LDPELKLPSMIRSDSNVDVNDIPRRVSSLDTSVAETQARAANKSGATCILAASRIWPGGASQAHVVTKARNATTPAALAKRNVSHSVSGNWFSHETMPSGRDSQQ
jgi:hypothetical protein